VAEEHLAYRLLIADVYELAGLSRRLSDRDAAAHGTTTARWHVLSVVSDRPATVPAIAGRLGLVRQAVQRITDELVAAGELERRDNPAHARSPLVAITAAGRATLDALWADTDRSRTALLASAGVTAAELDRARDSLSRILDALRPLVRNPHPVPPQTPARPGRTQLRPGRRSGDD
jgi:DNA-binding MarR family transcriptional regulator